MRYFLEIRFYDAAGQPETDWQRLARPSTNAIAAMRRGLNLEARNMANGADCTFRVMDEQGNEVSGGL